MICKDNKDTVAIDCEMVAVGKEQKSALARAAIVDYNGNVLYDKVCRPEEEITDYRTKDSGIKRSDLDGAQSAKQVQKEVSEIIKVSGTT